LLESVSVATTLVWRLCCVIMMCARTYLDKLKILFHHSTTW
jgi:hypothetical protein